MYTYYWKKLNELEKEDVMGYISLDKNGRKGLVSLRIKHIYKSEVNQLGYARAARRHSHMILPKQIDDSKDKKDSNLQYDEDKDNHVDVHIKDIVETSAWLKSLTEVYF